MAWRLALESLAAFFAMIGLLHVIRWLVERLAGKAFVVSVMRRTTYPVVVSGVLVVPSCATETVAPLLADT